MMVWVLALGLAMPVQAAQQESLADRAERARKAKPAGSPATAGKVLTNDDLASAKGTVIVLPEPAAEPEPEAGATAENAAKPATPQPTEDELRAQAGAALQKQIDGEVEFIRAGEKAIAEWEAELNDITNYTFGSRRAALMQNIEDARKHLADAQRKIDDLEDQARRQGIRVTLP